jgi:hypothetical protein
MYINQKKKIYTIALILVLTFSMIIVALPLATAHDPAWEIPTYAYLSVSPNPIGVNQQAIIVGWVNWPLPNAAQDNDIRFQGYEVTITKPDGTIQTIPMSSADTTSTSYVLYTPDQQGTYQLVFSHPGIEYIWSGVYQNDTFLGATSKTVSLVVQEEPIQATPGVPLPTEYWSRPIEGQNTEWYEISSNWLGRNSGQIIGGGNWGGGGIQPFGIAPKSPHVMWAKPLEFGGIVGGPYGNILGESYYTGLSYEGRYSDPLIIHGRLYYDTPLGNDPNDGPYTCVDLRTGETIWENPDISPTFGQLYYYETPNQHGVIPSGYLWQTAGSTWRAYDPLSGQNLFNLTNVPSGLTAYSEKGEILRYVFNYQNRWLALWNNTAAPDEIAGQFGFLIWQWRPVGKEIDASSAISWNVTLPDLPGSGTPRIYSVIPNDIMIGTSTNFAAFNSFLTPDPYTFWAINLDPNRGQGVGELLWIRDYPAPAGNLTLSYLGAPNVNNLNLPVDPVNRVFFVTDKEYSQWRGFSLDTGEMLWGPVGDFRATQYFGTTSNPPAIGYPAYGKLFVAGYGGILYAFDSSNGNLLWTYGNGGPGNSTSSGYDTPWGNYPIFISAISDGIVYLFTSEHSPNTPLYKGARVRAINATSGEELWTILGWHASGGFGQWATPIADGYLNFYNVYDARVYVIGKGPSAITVSAPDMGVTKDSSVTIKGTIMDIAAGTTQHEQSARFPNGVPAVSDDSMGPWMEYVYMQKPKPEDTMGVPIRIQVVDPSGEYAWIGTATSDVYGNFAYSFIPQMEGQYTIIATFDGSESYYKAEAATYMAVGPTPVAFPTIPEYPGYQGPSAQEVAQNVVNSLPDNPTPEQISQAVISQLPPYPEQQIPEYTTIDIVIIILVAIAIIIGIVSLMQKRK